MAACKQQAAHQLRHVLSGFFAHHGAQLQEGSVEQFVFLPRPVPAPMTPRRLGVRTRTAAVGLGATGVGVRPVGLRRDGRAGEGLDVGPVDGQRGGGLFVLGRNARFDEGVDEVLECLSGHPVGVLLRKGVDQEPEGPLHLAIGEPVRPALPWNHDPQRFCSSSPSAPRAAWTRLRWAGRPSERASMMPISSVRTLSWRSRTPTGSSPSRRGATLASSTTASMAARDRGSITTPRRVGPPHLLRCGRPRWPPDLPGAVNR